MRDYRQPLDHAVQAPNMTSMMRDQVNNHDRVDEMKIDKKLRWFSMYGQSI
jgi:hypothetical protein